MLPFVYDFQWTPQHLIFLGAFFAVVLAIGATLLKTSWQAKRERVHANELRWRVEFDELPERYRHCRHEFTGEFPDRVCPRAFDCRKCGTHASLVANHAPAPVSGNVEVSGVTLPLDRMYSRGHVWVKEEEDGTLTLGPDELVKRLFTGPAECLIPTTGTTLNANAPAWTIRTDGDEFRVLSPIDGEVVEQGAPDQPFWLRVRPADAMNGTAHLLRGAEVRPWLMREVERLQMIVSGPAGIASLADGGTLAECLDSALPERDRSAVRGAILLEP